MWCHRKYNIGATTNLSDTVYHKSFEPRVSNAQTPNAFTIASPSIDETSSGTYLEPLLPTSTAVTGACM